MFFVKKDEEKEQFACIIFVEDPIMIVTEQHEEVTLEKLLHGGFEAAYTKSKLYKLMDLFYQYLSPTNMRITPQELVELLEPVLISGKINKRSRGI
ncbi:hypothetical protein ABEX44_07215 [Priestia megaterium]